MADLDPTLVARFWSQVDCSGGPDACWPWTAFCSPKGYGQFYAGYKRTPAHRLSWMLVHGPIPNGLFVLHRCDNPPCVNVRHLFLGTIADNNADMLRKGRYATGSSRSDSKLTDDAVRAIRAKVADGTPQHVIATAHGVCKATVWEIAHRKRWGHVE